MQHRISKAQAARLAEVAARLEAAQRSNVNAGIRAQSLAPANDAAWLAFSSWGFNPAGGNVNGS